MKRIFIVGIARSGTTLLQSMVGNHPDICTFPETHFFSATLPKQKLLRLVHKISDENQQLVKAFFEVNKLEGYEPYSGNNRNASQWTKYLLKLLDNIAIADKKEIWLEKTPMHLHFIDLIEKNTDNCFFIHTIREPKANIAALYDVSKKHPDAFKQGSLEKAMNRYISEIAISQNFVSRPNHIPVYYEDLVQNPEEVLRDVFAFLNLGFNEDIMNFQSNVEEIISQDESWKANNRSELKLKDKIHDRLTTDEIEYLDNNLSYINSPLLDRYDN